MQDLTRLAVQYFQLWNFLVNQNYVLECNAIVLHPTMTNIFWTYLGKWLNLILAYLTLEVRIESLEMWKKKMQNPTQGSIKKFITPTLS
jgi:hypothetical protein